MRNLSFSCDLTRIIRLCFRMDFKVGVVLPAGGCGERMGISTPKQYCHLLNRPLLSHTVKAFERASFVAHIVVAIPVDKVQETKLMLEKFQHKKVSITNGATTRHRSIYNALKAIKKEMPDIDVVVIHDAVRPFVEEELIKSVATAAQKHGVAGAIRPLVSTVIATDMDGFMDHSLERIRYRNSEMPQAFKYDVIRSAYEKCTDYDLDYGTECLHLAHKYMGTKARLIDGPPSLWKITNKQDLYAAEGILREQENVVKLFHFVNQEFECILKESLKAKGLHVQDDAENANNLIFFESSLDPQQFRSHLKKCSQQMTNESGGIIIFVIKTQVSSIFLDFQRTIRELSHELRNYYICVNGILWETEGNTYWEDMCQAISCLVFDRNLSYSGQVMLF